MSKQTSSSLTGGLTSELDVKFYMYECCIKLEDFKQGMAVLEGMVHLLCYLIGKKIVGLRYSQPNFQSVEILVTRQ